MCKRLSFLAVLAATMGHAFAAPDLAKEEQVIARLKATPACCVIDARDAVRRKLRPLADAVVWGDGVVIVPTGTVVIIADDDKTGSDVGRVIEKRFKARHVVVVKGGLDTWDAVVRSAQEPGMPTTFVIPRNTCEQGQPLQTLRSNKK
jgi:hypothetical protein